MASIISSSTAVRNHSVLLPRSSGVGSKKLSRDHVFLKSANKPRSNRKSTVVNMATTRTPKPFVADPSDQRADTRYHVAWSSVQKDRFEGELQVQGQLPSWLDGTYLRNGPGIWQLGDYEVRHLFDGYALLSRLSFGHGRLFFSHRHIETEAYKAAMASNKVCYREFSEAPKTESFLAYVGELATLFSGKSLTDNANTGVTLLPDGRVLCLTETQKGSILVDPDTLDTVGKFVYDDNLGTYMIHAAHPVVNEKELLTLLPDLANWGYVVVRMLPGSNKREVIGRVDCRGGAPPGWVHAFIASENYVIVPEMPLRYCVQHLLKNEPSPLYKFEWLPETKAYVHVMCKKSGNIISSVEVPNYITFHFFNAYEEHDEDERLTSIVVDCCEHNADPTILDGLKLSNLRAVTTEDILPDARVGRFRIPVDGSPYGTLEAALDPNEHGRGMDMCSINQNFLGKKYRYGYACGARRPANFPNAVSKLDFVAKKAKNWHEPGAIPSEPFFVPRPGATEEDDGVVITMISQKNGEGYALVLNGQSFEEVARAKFPYGLPYGLHGAWVPRKMKKN